MYHAIGTAIDGDYPGLYSLSPDQFREQMHHLARSHSAEVSGLAVAQPSGDRIAVTFDDGYIDVLRTAAPLLADLKIPFTVFACTAAVSERRRGFLTPRDARELDAMPGASIGSHGMSHAPLTGCSAANLERELVNSKSYLEDLLGHAVCALSYPHGAVDRRVRDAAQSAGYSIGATSRFDINLPGRDPLLLCRTDVWAEDDLEVFGAKLRGDWDWMRWRTPDPAVG